MTKAVFQFFRTLIVTSVIAFFSIASILIACSYFHVIDFYHQLDPMLMTSTLISMMVGLIQAVRTISYEQELTFPEGSVFVPARAVPSNLSRPSTCA